MTTQYHTIICDLDGTLAPSRSPIDASTAEVITDILSMGKNMVIITGGMQEQILSQVVDQLPSDAVLEHVYLMPTSGSRMLQYQQGTWQVVYTHDLSSEEKTTIDEVVQAVLDLDLVEIPEQTWGPIKEDRSSQISYSMLGQEAPSRVKQSWDPDRSKRKLLVSHIAPKLPEFAVSYGGTTTIDITQKGIDKGFGIKQFFAHTNLDIKEALFIGDAMDEEGNDYPAISTGIDTYTTSGPNETREVLRDQC